MKGHIYRRTRSDGTDGRWHAVIDLPPGPGGKRRQRTTTHDTRRQAQVWLAKTAEEIRTLDLPDETITVAPESCQLSVFRASARARSGCARRSRLGGPRRCARGRRCGR